MPRRLADTIVVVPEDNDMVPVFDSASRQGLRVPLDPLGAPVRRDWNSRADRIL